MQILELSEATAARRRVFVHLVDATDGLTPETGEAGGQPQLSKNGAAFGNTTATLTAIGNGAYYVELTAAELDTAGGAIVRYKSANTAEAQALCQVVAFDPYDAVRLGLTALPNAAAEAAGGLLTRGTGAGQINQAANGQIDVNVVAVSGDAAAADNAEAFFDGTGYAGTNNTIPTVTTVNGIAANAITAAATAADFGTEVADALLKRDMSAVTGEAARSPLNALRFMRNKWSIGGTTLTVTKEDDTTAAWTSTLTGTAGADPITASDPA